MRIDTVKRRGKTDVTSVFPLPYWNRLSSSIPSTYSSRKTPDSTTTTRATTYYHNLITTKDRDSSRTSKFNFLVSYCTNDYLNNSLRLQNGGIPNATNNLNSSNWVRKTATISEQLLPAGGRYCPLKGSMRGSEESGFSSYCWSSFVMRSE